MLVPAPQASAHINDFYIGDAFGDHETEWIFANGSISCAAGERFRVTVKLIDEDFVYKSSTRGTCDGGTGQFWFVRFTEGTGGDGCAEQIRARAHTKINGVQHDDATSVVTNFGDGCP